MLHEHNAHHCPVGQLKPRQFRAMMLWVSGWLFSNQMSILLVNTLPTICRPDEVWARRKEVAIIRVMARRMLQRCSKA